MIPWRVHDGIPRFPRSRKESIYKKETKRTRLRSSFLLTIVASSSFQNFHGFSTSCCCCCSASSCSSSSRSYSSSSSELNRSPPPSDSRGEDIPIDSPTPCQAGRHLRNINTPLRPGMTKASVVEPVQTDDLFQRGGCGWIESATAVMSCRKIRNRDCW